MNTQRALAGLASLALGLMVQLPAHSKTISVSGHGPGQVKKSCSGAGDVYFPKKGSKGTYGCMHADGGGIVCGGVTPKFQRTCDTPPGTQRQPPAEPQGRQHAGGLRRLEPQRQTGPMGPTCLALARASGEREGFEPSIQETCIPDFESGAFDHSATFPDLRLARSTGRSRIFYVNRSPPRQAAGRIAPAAPQGVTSSRPGPRASRPSALRRGAATAPPRLHPARCRPARACWRAG